MPRGRRATSLHRLFDHVAIRASDGAASTRFYEVVLGTLGAPKHVGDGWTAWGSHELFVLEDAACTRRLHVGFAARSREQVHDFWDAGVAAGYRDDGAPGPRPEYGSTYYGGFLLDPDGNSAEAVHHEATENRGLIDHLWIRVADLAASTAFYEAIAPHAGFRLANRGTHPERTQFGSGRGSFSVVADGEPVEGLHMAFPASASTTVDAFHREALSSGYRDNGPPGFRPEYHERYYGAFVLDPDGNNVEVVNHNRG